MLASHLAFGCLLGVSFFWCEFWCEFFGIWHFGVSFFGSSLADFSFRSLLVPQKTHRLNLVLEASISR